MIGGFEGVKKIASEEDIDGAKIKIEERLKQKLSEGIMTKIPDNFILYDEGLFFTN